MADITSELSKIATSIYGSEMRSAIHDAIEKVNNDTTSPIINDFDLSGETPNDEYMCAIEGYANGMMAVLTITIMPVNGRSGYDPETPDAGLVLCTLPTGLIPSNCAVSAQLPGDFSNIVDIPYVKVTDGNDELKIFNAYDEILGNQEKFIVNLVYFTCGISPST